MTHFDTTTPQLRLLERVFRAYRNRDLSDLPSLYSEDFTYKWFPKSTELPDENREEHIKSLGPMFAKLTKNDQIVHEVIEAPGKVVVQYTARMSTPPDGAIIEYDSLSIITFVEEDGELKVLEFKDFADPEKRSCFHKTLSQKAQIA